MVDGLKMEQAIALTKKHCQPLLSSPLKDNWAVYYNRQGSPKVGFLSPLRLHASQGEAEQEISRMKLPGSLKSDFQARKVFVFAEASTAS